MYKYSKKILPALLIAGFFFSFFYEVQHYKVNIDDCYNDYAVSHWGVAKAAQKSFSDINGRWFSHIITSFTFLFLKHDFFLYAVYLTVFMLLFVFAVNSFYRGCFQSKKMPQTESLFFSFTFTAALYFLLYDGRHEIWIWVSSVNNHLLSVILSFFLFSVLLKKQYVATVILIILLSAFIGGLNEVNALCTVLVISLLFLQQNKFFIRINKRTLLLSFMLISASLLVNIFSGGYESRMNGLPAFNLFQSVKNTAHTALMPFLQQNLILLRLIALLVFLFSLDERFYRKRIGKEYFFTIILSLALMLVSFFLHCLILSDIVPPRGETWACALFLLMLVFAFQQASISPKHSRE